MINQKLILAIAMALFGKAAIAIEVITPNELQTSSIQIIDPDDHVKTLGKVSFKIDLSAAHDDLLALKVRRSTLTLRDGRSFTAFGVHKEAGLIVLGAGEITHISIANVNSIRGTRDTSVLFYGKDNEVISPKPEDIAVFDTGFNHLNFKYTPLQTPGSLTIPVSIALDTSGSMDGHMSSVISATKDFMSNLPDFTYCRLLSFSDDVNLITSQDINQLANCPSSAYLLNGTLQANGCKHHPKPAAICRIVKTTRLFPYF